MNEIATPTGIDPQAKLLAFVGQWEGITQTWFEPGNLGDESPWQGKIYAILGDRYVQYDYNGTMQGDSFEGKAMIGYNSMTKQFEMAWIDSFHQSTGIMHCKGHETATGIAVLGSYRASDNGEDWGWRTEFDLVDADHLTIRAYNIMPDGIESLGIETVYMRC